MVMGFTQEYLHAKHHNHTQGKQRKIRGGGVPRKEKRKMEKMRELPSLESLGKAFYTARGIGGELRSVR